MYTKVTNILNIVEVGEDGVNLGELITSFSCPINPAIETFIKEHAIDFAKRQITPPALMQEAYRPYIVSLSRPYSSYGECTHRGVRLSAVFSSQGK